jgi:hypothetical protein
MIRANIAMGAKFSNAQIISDQIMSDKVVSIPRVYLWGVTTLDLRGRRNSYTRLKLSSCGPNDSTSQGFVIDSLKNSSVFL